MNCVKFAIILSALVATFSAAHATSIIYDGTTVGEPTWNRPFAVGDEPPTDLSTIGTAVSYSFQFFEVDVAGDYVFQSTVTGPDSWDNYTFLYIGAFDPTIPFANILIGNDDNDSIGGSGFTYRLEASTRYTFVTTGFANDDFGTFRNSIFRLPETGSIVPMFGVVCLGLALAHRSGKRAKAPVA
jgi:hypothetical protein